jgi:apolipoprotein N-acyltransferase
MTTVVLLVLSQSPHDLGSLATIALVPWLIALGRSGPLFAFVISVVVGVGYAILGANWLFAALQSQGTHGVRGVLSALVVALWGKGLLFGVTGWFTQRLFGRVSVIRMIAPAALFGLAEHWISTSPWGLPLLLLGHSQHSIAGVAQLAVAVGVPGISILLFAVNAAFASIFIEGRSGTRAAISCAAIWLAIAIGGLPIARAFDSTFRSSAKILLVVQPNIPPAHRWEAAYQQMILDGVADEVSRAITESGRTPHAILWPENLLTFPVTQENQIGRRLQDYVNDWGVPVVTGLVREVVGGETGRYRNSAVWWSPLIGQRDAVDKVRAIPLVESSRAFWGRGALERMVGQAAKGPRVEEAEIARPLRGEFTLSPALCFEVLFPRIVADRRDEQSVAIVNFADDSWVAGEVVDAQLIAAASFRAIEQRLTLVRVSHGGLSVVINRFGETIASLEPDTVAHLSTEVAASPLPSALEKAAILLPAMIAGLLVWALCPFFGRRLERTRGSISSPGGTFREDSHGLKSDSSTRLDHPMRKA